MIILGVALLAGCTLLGQSIGMWLGVATGLNVNVGGVGIAMVVLILASEYLKRRGALPEPTKRGVEFWSAIYVPIVVAMASQQNVRGAFSSGMVSILSGACAVAAGFALVPYIARLGRAPHQPPSRPTPGAR